MLKIKPIMLKIMLSKSRLCLRTNCSIRVHEYLPIFVLKQMTALLEYLNLISENC